MEMEGILQDAKVRRLSTLLMVFCFTGLPAIVVAGSAVLFHEGYGTKDL